MVYSYLSLGNRELRLSILHTPFLPFIELVHVLGKRLLIRESIRVTARYSADFDESLVGEGPYAGVWRKMMVRKSS